MQIKIQQVKTNHFRPKSAIYAQQKPASRLNNTNMQHINLRSPTLIRTQAASKSRAGESEAENEGVVLYFNV
jgi:hypothetical protein